MSSTILFPIFAALLGGAPVSSQDGSTHAVQAPVKEKKICRREVETGSIMAKTICRTRKELDERTARGQQDAQRLREHSQMNSTGQ